MFQGFHLAFSKNGNTSCKSDLGHRKQKDLRYTLGFDVVLHRDSFANERKSISAAVTNGS